MVNKLTTRDTFNHMAWQCNGNSTEFENFDKMGVPHKPYALGPRLWTWRISQNIVDMHKMHYWRELLKFWQMFFMKLRKLHEQSLENILLAKDLLMPLVTLC